MDNDTIKKLSKMRSDNPAKKFVGLLSEDPTPATSPGSPPIPPGLLSSASQSPSYSLEERRFRDFYKELVSAGWLKSLELSWVKDKSIPEGELKEYGKKLTELIKNETDIRKAREYYYAIKWLLKYYLREV